MSNIIRNSKFLIRVFFSVALIVFFINFIDIKTLGATLFSLDTLDITLILLIYLISQVISSYKWYLLANASGVKTSFPRALRAYFSGMYFNAVGIGILGGDVVRGMMISSNSDHGRGILSVAADRFHGLAVLATIGSIALIIQVLFVSSTIHPVTILLPIVAFLIPFFWWKLPTIISFLPESSSPKIKKLLSIFSFVPSDPSMLAKISLISGCFHIMQLLLHSFILGLLGAYVPIIQIFTTVPLVNIASSLPISYQGVGIREGGYLLFWSTIVSPENIIALGGIWFIAVSFSAIVGAVLVVFNQPLSQHSSDH